MVLSLPAIGSKKLELVDFTYTAVATLTEATVRWSALEPYPAANIKATRPPRNCLFRCGNKIILCLG